MKLTGKCKVEFEEWYYLIDDISKHFNTDDFYQLPDSMKYGVLQDYFDSVGIQIGLNPIHLNTGDIDRWDFDVDDCRYKYYSKTLPEAQPAAIEKACEIRNEQLNKKPTN